MLLTLLGSFCSLVSFLDGGPSSAGALVGWQDSAAPQAVEPAAYVEVSFPSKDDLVITADLYRRAEGEEGKCETPFILLCHQAGWSRGEYREIAPKLNRLGFDCLAIDQRSGGGINKVQNETATRAKAAKKQVAYVDAEQDILAALAFVHENYADGPVILWGSSYSSALSLRVAGEHPELVDGVLAFAPGEYFTSSGKPKDWITQSARKIAVPAFVTSAKNELPAWESLFEAIPDKRKASFLPKSAGNHGSRALWEQFDDSPKYWEATTDFLGAFLPEQAADGQPKRKD